MPTTMARAAETLAWEYQALRRGRSTLTQQAQLPLALQGIL